MGELSKKVGKRIKELRENIGLKQYELAEKLEMEPSNLTRIESGYQMPKEENLFKISKILGVKEKDLFDFGETFSQKELIRKILEILEKSNKKEVEFVYNMLMQIKQIK